MSDGLTDAELREIRDRTRSAACLDSMRDWQYWYEEDVPHLLAEVERLRTALSDGAPAQPAAT